MCEKERDEKRGRGRMGEMLDPNENERQGKLPVKQCGDEQEKGGWGVEKREWPENLSHLEGKRWKANEMAAGARSIQKAKPPPPPPFFFAGTQGLGRAMDDEGTRRDGGEN